MINKSAFGVIPVTIPATRYADASEFNTPISSPSAYAFGVNKDGPRGSDILYCKKHDAKTLERYKALKKDTNIGTIAGLGGGAGLGALLANQFGDSDLDLRKPEIAIGALLGGSLGTVAGNGLGSYFGAKKYNEHLKQHGDTHTVSSPENQKHISAQMAKSNRMADYAAGGATIGSLSGVALRALSDSGVLGEGMQHMSQNTVVPYGVVGGLLGLGGGALAGHLTHKKEAFDNGFQKRAAELGYSTKQANDLLNHLINPVM